MLVCNKGSLIAPLVAYLIQEIKQAEVASCGKIENFSREQKLSIWSRWVNLKRIAECYRISDEIVFRLMLEEANFHRLEQPWVQTISNVIHGIKEERTARAAS